MSNRLFFCPQNNYQIKYQMAKSPLNRFWVGIWQTFLWFTLGHPEDLGYFKKNNQHHQIFFFFFFSWKAACMGQEKQSWVYVFRPILMWDKDGSTIHTVLYGSTTCFSNGRQRQLWSKWTQYVIFAEDRSLEQQLSCSAGRNQTIVQITKSNMRLIDSDENIKTMRFPAASS